VVIVPGQARRYARDHGGDQNDVIVLKQDQRHGLCKAGLLTKRPASMPARVWKSLRAVESSVLHLGSCVNDFPVLMALRRWLKWRLGDDISDLPAAGQHRNG
jgi:hypothetical protein